MLFIRYFWETLESSVNPLFFRKAVQKSAVRAFGYYLFFTTVYTLAVCGAGMWWLSRHWSPALEMAQKHVPPVEIKVRNGRFSTTLPQPAVLGDEDFSLILDTMGEETDLSPYKNALLVSRTKAIIKQNGAETGEYGFDAIPDFQITTADAIGWLRDYKEPVLWTLFATMGLLVIPMFWFFLIPAILLLMLLMMIPTKLIRSNLSYSQVLAIGFYGVTFPTLLETYFLIQGRTGNATFRWIYLAWCFAGVIAARTLGKPRASTPVSPPSPFSGNSGIGSGGTGGIV